MLNPVRVMTRSLTVPSRDAVPAGFLSGRIVIVAVGMVTKVVLLGVIVTVSADTSSKLPTVSVKPVTVIVNVVDAAVEKSMVAVTVPPIVTGDPVDDGNRLT